MSSVGWGRRGRDRIVAWFTIT